MDGLELDGLVVVDLAVEVLDVLQDHHPQFLLYVRLSLLARLHYPLVALLVYLALAVDYRPQVLALGLGLARFGRWLERCLHLLYLTKRMNIS